MEDKNMSVVAITTFLAGVSSVVGGGIVAGIGVIAGAVGVVGAGIGAAIAANSK